MWQYIDLYIEVFFTFNIWLSVLSGRYDWLESKCSQDSEPAVGKFVWTFHFQVSFTAGKKKCDFPIESNQSSAVFFFLLR